MHLDLVQLCTLILVIGVGTQWLASRLQVPALLLLMGVGIVLGPVTGVLRPYKDFGESIHIVIHAAVALVLFEGGLTLNLREVGAAGKTLWRLIISGLFLGGALLIVLAGTVAGLSWPTAAVLGAILVVTGPTVIIPMLRGARVSMRPATMLKWEGIVNDPLGALMAVFVFQAALIASDEGLSHGLIALLLGLIVSTAVAGAIGTLVALGLGKAMSDNWIAEHLKIPVMLSSVMLVFSVTEALHHDHGLFAVTVLGIVLANIKEANLDDIRHFKEQISTILISFLFIVLSASLEPESLGALIGRPGIYVILVLVVARPLVVLAATWRSDLGWNERALLAWIAPRGVVAAAVAGTFQVRLTEAGFSDAHLIVPIVFGVIISTVILQGLTLGPMARRLGLGAIDGNGILIVGSPSWGVDLARTLDKAGAHVVLTDRRYERVTKARQEGVEVYFGDVLSEEAEVDLPLERLTWLLAASDDDSYNSLVCMSYGSTFGRRHTLQWSLQQDSKRRENQHNRTGLMPWGERASCSELTRLFWRYGGFKVTSVSQEFSFEDLKDRNPNAVFLFYVFKERVVAMDADTGVPAGAKVILLAGDEVAQAERAGAASAAITSAGAASTSATPTSSTPTKSRVAVASGTQPD